jgi:hypothetical protein
MYIAKLNDGPKRVKKTFSMVLERVFEMVWWRGREWNHIKKDFWSWNTFLLSKYWLPLLFEETLGAFLFSSSFLLLLCSISWGLGGLDDIWGENYFFKNFFSIDLNILEVDAYSKMEHTNMAEPWLWRWGSCGYIGGGHIFQSGVMHANIFRWG